MMQLNATNPLVADAQKKQLAAERALQKQLFESGMTKKQLNALQKKKTIEAKKGFDLNTILLMGGAVIVAFLAWRKFGRGQK